MEQVTAWGRMVERRALRLLGVLTRITATALLVKTVVVDWVCGPGWPVVERVIAVTGPGVVAGLVAVTVFAVSLVRGRGGRAGGARDGGGPVTNGRGA